MINTVATLALCPLCCGKCCRLYLPREQGGMYSSHLWFDEYCRRWFSAFVESGALLRNYEKMTTVNPASGVAPLHSPIPAHAQGRKGDAYRASLPRWVDIHKCQFCHPDSGCLLDRQFRPRACREYMCKRSARITQKKAASENFQMPPSDRDFPIQGRRLNLKAENVKPTKNTVP